MITSHHTGGLASARVCIQHKVKHHQEKLAINGKKKQFAGDSNTLSSEMRVALESLKKGDEFTFRRVKARIGDDDFDVYVKPFTVV